MSEDLDSMAKRFKEVRDALKGAFGRPDVTMRDNVAVVRGKIGQWTHNMMNRNQEASQQNTPQVLAQQQGRPPQEAGSLLGQGRPTILGSLMQRFQQPQQQQAPQQPQMSEEQIENQRQEHLAYQMAREKALNEQKNLARLKKRRGFSIVPE